MRNCGLSNCNSPSSYVRRRRRRRTSWKKRGGYGIWTETSTSKVLNWSRNFAIVQPYYTGYNEIDAHRLWALFYVAHESLNGKGVEGIYYWRWGIEENERSEEERWIRSVWDARQNEFFVSSLLLVPSTVSSFHRARRMCVSVHNGSLSRNDLYSSTHDKTNGR